MKFKTFLEEAAWALMGVVGLYAASQLKELTASVAALNTNVAVLIERVSSQDKNQYELKQRVDAIQAELSDLRKRR